MDLKKVFVIVISIIACLLVIGWIVSSKSETSGAPKDVKKGKTAIEVIMSRTSVRKFQNREVGKDTVNIILKAGMSAPTAMNLQPWAFIVVDDKSLLKELADSLPNAKMSADASFAIVACGDSTRMLKGENSGYWIQDVSAATENMLVAINSLGLGAVWTGLFPNMDKVGKVRSVLNVPSHLVPLNLIPVGYPAETPKVKDKWDSNKVFYNSFDR